MKNIIKFNIYYRRTFQVLLSGFWVFAFSGCALSVLFPGSLNQRPDVSGKLFSGDVSVGLEQYVEVTVIKDITTTPPTRPTDATNGLTLETFFPALPVVNYNIGILPQVDLYYTGHLGAKYQFVGARKQQGWKAAAFAGYGTQKASISEVACTGGMCSGEVILSGMEYGFSIGHSISPLNLAYFTLGQQKGNAATKITQPAQIYNYDDSYEHTIASLGLEFGETIYVNPEVSFSQNKWSTNTETARKSATTWFVAVGWKW